MGLPGRFNSEAPSSRRLLLETGSPVSRYLPAWEGDDPEVAALRAMIDMSPSLTDRERAVLVLTACGSRLSAQSPWRGRLQAKLGFSSSADLARCALRFY